MVLKKEKMLHFVRRIPFIPGLPPQPKFPSGISELEVIADRLNWIPHFKRRESRVAWEHAEKIIELMSNDPIKAANLFNHLARKSPVFFVIGRYVWKGKPVALVPFLRGSTAMEVALGYIWLGTLKGDWSRFKRCPQCKQWFVDQTRNNKKARCSEDCTWRYWSRGKRKEVLESKKRKEVDD